MCGLSPCGRRRAATGPQSRPLAARVWGLASRMGPQRSGRERVYGPVGRYGPIVTREQVEKIESERRRQAECDRRLRAESTPRRLLPLAPLSVGRVSTDD